MSKPIILGWHKRITVVKVAPIKKRPKYPFNCKKRYGNITTVIDLDHSHD